MGGPHSNPPAAPGQPGTGERADAGRGGAGMTGREAGYAVLGESAPAQQRTGRPLPFADERHLQAHQWLVDEAYLLDGQQYESWLDLLTDDIHYHMPVRVTTALGAGFDTAPGMAHFDEDKYSLSRRFLGPGVLGHEPRTRRRGSAISSPTCGRSPRRTPG